MVTTEKEIKDPVLLDEILKLTPNDITISLIKKYFAKHSPTEPPMFNTNDYFILPKEKFKTKKEGYTTIGIYIVNLHLIQPNFSFIFGYINKPFSGDVIEWVEDELSNALYNDKITTDQMADYYNRIQWLGGHDDMSFLSPSLTPALLKPAPGLMKKKDRLFKEHKKELDAGDAKVAAAIEKELISDAVDYLKKDEGYENVASKSKINIDNNYKTMNII